MRFPVEVLPIQTGRFPIALNTPMDQIPLTITDAWVLITQLQVAIRQVTQNTEKESMK
jgi:hypothetical protein